MGVGRYTLNGKRRSISPGEKSCELESGKYDLTYSLH